MNTGEIRHFYFVFCVCVCLCAVNDDDCDDCDDECQLLTPILYLYVLIRGSVIISLINYNFGKYLQFTV